MARFMFFAAAVLGGLQAAGLARKRGLVSYEAAGALLLIAACVVAGIQSKPRLSHPELMNIPLVLLGVGGWLIFFGRRRRGAE